MRVAILLALLVTAPGAIAQARQPQTDYMVHMDLGASPPRYVPDELVLVPGGLVQLMLFGKGDAHTLTLDVPGYAAIVPAGTQDGFYERSAEFRAPTQPGEYRFHDEKSGATGRLIVQAAQQGALVGVRENGYELHFEPATLTVEPGETVTFRTNGTFAHTLTSETNAWDDAGLRLGPGQSASFTAPTQPGTYAFYCRYHKDAGMTGTLIVQGSPKAQEGSKPTPPGSLGVGFLVVGLAAILRRRARWT